MQGSAYHNPAWPAGWYEKLRSYFMGADDQGEAIVSQEPAGDIRPKSHTDAALAGCAAMGWLRVRPQAFAHQALVRRLPEHRLW